jgi:hypothetical protein
MSLENRNDSMRMKYLTVIDGAHVFEPSCRDVVQDLRELIIALDRRVPHRERKGEVVIARDAALLRDGALERIAELESTPSTAV